MKSAGYDVRDLFLSGSNPITYLVNYMPEPGQVLLGIAGDLILDAGKLTEYCSKAGGRPIFAGSVLPDGAEGVRCQECDSQLALVVQVLLSLCKLFQL